MKNSKLKFCEYMQNISRSKSFGKFVLIVYVTRKVPTSKRRVSSIFDDFSPPLKDENVIYGCSPAVCVAICKFDSLPFLLDFPFNCDVMF